jgi:hypothetical protein
MRIFQVQCKRNVKEIEVLEELVLEVLQSLTEQMALMTQITYIKTLLVFVALA